jgi:hypothetical protein
LDPSRQRKKNTVATKIKLKYFNPGLDILKSEPSCGSNRIRVRTMSAKLKITIANLFLRMDNGLKLGLLERLLQINATFPRISVEKSNPLVDSSE